MERPRLVPGGKLLDGDYFFLIFCEQPLDKLSQLGFVLGQGGRLVDFVGGQNKGTSGDKEENEDKFVHQYRSYSETDSKFKAIFPCCSHLEQVLPARKLARGGARPGLGTMSTSEGNFMIATFFEAPLVIVCT